MRRKENREGMRQGRDKRWQKTRRKEGEKMRNIKKTREGNEGKASEGRMEQGTPADANNPR